MSKDKLQSLQTDSSGSTSGGPRKRSLSFLLPVGLVIGFLIIFALLFGERLLPAVKVQTAPVITLRTAEGAMKEITSPLPDSKLPSPTSSLLFQASGWVEPDPYTTVVPTLQNGVVHEVHVLEGATVKQGDLLATLVNEDALLNLQQAERKLETLRARIAAHCSQGPSLSANLEAGRKKVLSEEARLSELEDTSSRLDSLPAGAVPPQDVKQAKIQVARQLAVVDAARAEIPRLEAELVTLDFERIAMGNNALEIQTEIDRAQLAVERTKITAPMNGIVLQLHAAPGKKRMLDMDDPASATIVELYDPAKLQARIDVPLNEASQLGLGQPVALVTDLLPNTEFKGMVTRLVGEADLQRNTLQVKVQLLNPDPRLRPGMLMRAKFYAGGGNRAQGNNSAGNGSRLTLYAPTDALFDITETSAQAWVAIDNRSVKRDLILTAETRDGHHRVTSGLHSGEQLILPPHDKLSEGIRIKLSSDNR